MQALTLDLWTEIKLRVRRRTPTPHPVVVSSASCPHARRPGGCRRTRSQSLSACSQMSRRRFEGMRWDFYAQIEDEVAVTQARLTWVDRLSAAQGRQVALEIGLGNSSGTNTVSGELKDVGEGWCAIGIDHQTVIVNSFWIQSIASSTTQPCQPVSLGVGRAGHGHQLCANSDHSVGPWLSIERSGIRSS